MFTASTEVLCEPAPNVSKVSLGLLCLYGSNVGLTFLLNRVSDKPNMPEAMLTALFTFATFSQGMATIDQARIARSVTAISEQPINGVRIHV